MHVAPLDGHLGRGGVEVLVLQLADRAAVHGVGEIAAELGDVELVGAQADLLVGVEADAHLAVLDLGMSLQVGHRGDDLGDAGLVVGAEKRRAVGHDQVVAQIVHQLGEVLGIERDALLGVERDGRAVIVAHDARVDMAARHVGARVHMSDEADHGHRPVGVGG